MKRACVAGILIGVHVSKDPLTAVETTAEIMAIVPLIQMVFRSVYHTQKTASPVVVGYRPLPAMSATPRRIIVHRLDCLCRAHPVFAQHFAWTTLTAKGLRALA